MRRFRNAAVLGALIVAGLVLLLSFPVAGKSPFVPFFRRAEHAFIRACAAATNPEACQVLVRGLFVATRGGGGSSLDEALSREIVRALKLPPGTSCVQCQNASKTFLDGLEANATINDIEAALHVPCTERYRDATLANDCKHFVDQYVPEIVNAIGHNVTPSTICTQLNFCPGP